MKLEKIEEFIIDSRSFLREMKLNSILESNFFTLKEPIIKFSLLNLSRKKINEFNLMGGILGGSRALSLYHINGVPLIKRKLNNWDFILDKEVIMNYFHNNKLNFRTEGRVFDEHMIRLFFLSKMIKSTEDLHIMSGNNVITGIPFPTFKKRDNYLFKNVFNLINGSPNYIKCNNFKILPIESILSHKIKVIENDIVAIPNYYTGYKSKHLTDCLESIIKIKTFYDPVDAALFALKYGEYDSLKSVLKIMDNKK